MTSSKRDSTRDMETDETSGARAKTRAFVGLGSNEGERLASLRSAVARIAEGALEHARLVGCSKVYETLPVGPSKGNFLNAVIEIEATSSAGLDPTELVEALLHLEAEHGRVRTERWADRTLDLDLLLVLEPIGEPGASAWASRTVATPRATVPHPRMLDRDFVLAPLCDLLPDLPVLDGRTPRERLRALPPEARSVLRRLDAPLRGAAAGDREDA